MLRHLTILLVTLGATLVLGFNDDTYDEAATNNTKPVRDRFRLIVSNANAERMENELQDFLAYGCEKMVVVKNQAQEAFRIACRSFHDAPRQATIQPGESYAFTFKPRRTGDTKFWCTVEYHQLYVRFDVYNEELSYMCPRDIEEVYQYIVHHDGVYVMKKGDHGQKIRALFKGHNKFLLWEEFVHNETDGYLTTGLVDGGMCYDIPEQFNDKTAAVTVCYNHCVHLYEHYGCHGTMQTLQATDGCIDRELSGELGGKLSAIQGC